MVLAALLVAIISAVLTGAGVVYNRRLTRVSEKVCRRLRQIGRRGGPLGRGGSQVSGRRRNDAALDADRRHSELTPRFRITCHQANPGSDTMRLAIYLIGPPELERPEALAVTIRDDHRWRA